MSEALYRKYRPATFEDVTDQDHVKTTLMNQIASDTVAHAYLFTGPRGVGKTTTARLLAKAVNCLKRKGAEPCNACAACEEIAGGASLDVFEIDAASQTDVENVRENIVKSVRFAPNKLKYKVYIIDEVHMLSTHSFNALLKTLEEPPAHALFILATTEIHKVPATIVSRCQRFDFKRIPLAGMVQRLKSLVKKEKMKVDEDVLEEIARHADGSERDAESLLGQILSLGEDHVTLKEASLIMPATNRLIVEEFLGAVFAPDAAKAVVLVNQYADDGIDMPHFVDDVIDELRARMASGLKKSENVAELRRAIEAFLEARRYLKTDRIPQLAVELAVLDIALPTASEPPEHFLEKREVDSSRTAPAAASAPIVPKEPVMLSEAKNPEKSFAPAQDDKVAAPSSVSLHDLKRRWNDVFEQVKATNASLPLIIQTGEIVGVDGNLVEMAFQFAFHADTLNQEKNRRAMEEIFQRVFGAPLKIRGVHKQPEGDAAVAAILEGFGGTMT